MVPPLIVPLLVTVSPLEPLPKVTPLSVPLFVSLPVKVPPVSVVDEPMVRVPPAMFVIVPPEFVTVVALRASVPVLVFVIPDELVNELVVPLIVSVPLLVTGVPLKADP